MAPNYSNKRPQRGLTPGDGLHIPFAVIPEKAEGESYFTVGYGAKCIRWFTVIAAPHALAVFEEMQRVYQPGQVEIRPGIVEHWISKKEHVMKNREVGNLEIVLFRSAIESGVEYLTRNKQIADSVRLPAFTWLGNKSKGGDSSTIQVQVIVTRNPEHIMNENELNTNPKLG